MERISKSAFHRITLLRGRESASKAVQHFGGHEVTLDDRGRVPQRLQFSKKKEKRQLDCQTFPRGAKNSGGAKLYRVTLICGDHEINSGSIAAITPHAAWRGGEGRPETRRGRRTEGASSGGAQGSPGGALGRWQEKEGRRSFALPRRERRRSRKSGRREKRKGARPASWRTAIRNHRLLSWNFRMRKESRER